MIGSPVPVVLEVGAGLLSDVEEHEGSSALLLGAGLGLGGLLAGVALETSASGATNTEVDIPHTSRSLGRGGNVPFHQDSTGSCALGGDDEVTHLNRARLALLTNLEDRNGVLGVLELRAVSHEHGPNFTSDANVLGNLDGGGDHVGTVVEVNNLVSSCAIKDLLDGLGVVGLSVTLGASRFNTDEGGSRNVLVQRLGAFEDSAVLEEVLGLVGGLERSLGATLDRKSTRLNSSHSGESRMPSSA